MLDSFLRKATELNDSKKPYATAVIVRRKIPSSGKPGDKAIITADGHIHGWIGGGCTQGIVLKEALLSMQEGKPRHISITPSGNKNEEIYTKSYSMTCQSGGEVDVFIEPVLPKPTIHLFGVSHIALALSKVAIAANYPVVCVGDQADKSIFTNVEHFISINDFEKIEDAYVVVCTQGLNDEISLLTAVRANPAYVSFVSSRKKANAIFSYLRKEGVNFDQLKAINTPAGIDIGAKLPEEVAISILAQIIQHSRQEKEQQPIQINNEDYYINPVCNIPIQKSAAKHILEHNGEKVYFCCDGCHTSFKQSPESYLQNVTK
jgi:xanthine dehydrogenase accessory factor